MVKDQDYLEKKALFCLDLAKKHGASNSSVIVSNSLTETVNFRNKKLDESNRSDNLSINITTYIDKKKSSISSSNLLNENLKILIEKCVETTKHTPEDEFNSLPDKDLLAKEVKDLNLYDKNHFENDKKIEYLNRLEESASKDRRIINTESSFSENKSSFILANSIGFCKGYKSSSFTASSVNVAKNDLSMERDYDFITRCHLQDIKSPENLGKTASDLATKKLNPRKISSEKISIIFDKRIAKGILSAFSNAITSSAISRGTSFLKNKINEKIFSKNINIYDKPDIIKGLGSTSFDTEGVKSNTLKLVENGILKYYLLDTYNGKKLNLKSNGRSSGSSNLYFDNGKISFKDLINSHSKILYITETIGHGTNIVTGDYSVGAAGFLIENGEFKNPINEFTIAGNFIDMFQNITLANDLEFEYPTNSPTMMIEGMVVAGK